MTPSDPRPRRIHYLDSRLQMRVMLVLVLFELLMLGIALWLLHDALRDAIEASLYSVHLAHDRRLPMVVGVALPVFFGLSIVNLLVVLVAAQLWSHHVGRVLGAFRARLARLAALDFEAAPLAPRPQHPLLDWLEVDSALTKPLCGCFEEVATMQLISSAGRGELFRRRVLKQGPEFRPVLKGDVVLDQVIRELFR